MPKIVDWTLLGEYEKSDMTIGSQERSTGLEDVKSNV